MANSQTINSLVALVRTRTDQVNSTTFDDETDLKPWIRASLAQLYELLTSRWLDYYTISRPISLLANQQSYSLPPDFRAMCDVYLLYNAGKYRERLQVFPPNQLGRYSNENLWRRWPMFYRIQRNQIFFTPPPDRDLANAIEIMYVPQYKAPLLDFSTIDDILPNGWDEWVVLDVMEKMNIKLRLDLTPVQQAKAQMAQRLLAASSVRDGEAPQMMDSYIYPRWTWLNGIPSGPFQWVAP